MKRVCAGPRCGVFSAALLLCLTVGPASLAAESNGTQTGEELFALHVWPAFLEKCLPCHGGDRRDIRGRFDMTSRAMLFRGGESGMQSVIPGQPDRSLLVRAVKRQGIEMPPKESDRLSDEQVEAVRDWVAKGAPWPTADRIEEILRANKDNWSAEGGIAVETSGGLSPEWTNRRYDPEQLWAYQPLAASPQDELPVDYIDRRIDERLRELELPPAEPADRRTLIRRLTFDLLGLPPTPQEIDEFLRDPRSDDEAYAALVDRLLAGPHYGEQAARHWLDVVRYADSSGFANDFERGNAWRYRDYVVRSFNEDKPYDEFIREQIAGDEIDPDDPEMLVAVGFLRMGPWELTGMEVAKVSRQRFLDDVTDAVGQVFLGHMLQCARCHDHKFDPVPTRDYYAMQAVFAATQIAERDADFLPQENISGFGEEKYLKQREAYYHEVIGELKQKQTLEAARNWYAEKGLDPAPLMRAIAEFGRDKPFDFQKVRQRMQERNVPPDRIPPKHVGFEPRDYGLERISRKGLDRLKWAYDRYRPVAMSVYNGPFPDVKDIRTPFRMPEPAKRAGRLERTSILAGGDPFSPIEPVSPGVLTAATKDGAGPPIPHRAEGRRLALADWIASKENPLTPRVMVNRLWQSHFGQGLAANPNNFGATGKRPSHPQLLDELAADFIRSGWSIKAMHGRIVLSQAYRRSSHHPAPDEVAERDPHGTSYALFQPRRLAAEELRDAMLHVSGELNPELGGVPARPEMNLEVALQPRQVMGTFAEAWEPSPLPAERHRRSLYAQRIRGLRDPFFEVFNAPNSDVSCEARETSTITPQVFALFNSDITLRRALAFAKRLEQETGGCHERHLDQAIGRLFELAYGRPATPDEMRLCQQHWRTMLRRHQQLKFPQSPFPREVLREAVEENTGERFEFTEPLQVAEDFVPDFGPHEASPELRALAEVCLVVLNSNEFVYVY